jgi:hypothetical protein
MSQGSGVDADTDLVGLWLFFYESRERSSVLAYLKHDLIVYATSPHLGAQLM